MNTEFEKKVAKEIHTALSHSTSTEEEARVLVALAKVLSEKKALNYSEGIISALKDLLDAEQGIIKVSVTVQERLDEESKTLLTQMLKEKYSAKEVVLNESVDQRVLGGIKLQIGEEVYDATVKNKLVQLARQLQVMK
jgi:F-type H+-transporting ATPase subunit delta